MLAPDTKPVVELFTGTSFSVHEIKNALDLLKFHVRDMTDAHEGKRAVSMKCAADDVARVASQIAALASHLSGVTAANINRRPRA